MTIDGIDALIWQRPRRKEEAFTASPKLAYTNAFESMQAKAAYGISDERYADLAGDPEWAEDDISKAHIIAWYRYHVVLRNLRDGF